MNNFDVFVFMSDTREFIEHNAFVVRVDEDIRSTKQLFELLSRLLVLPSYFGFNWNALFDCLRDFHWVNEKDVVIVHDELPELNASEMKIYLEVLSDAVADWRPGERHSLKVVFNDNDRARVEAVMTGGERWAPSSQK